jgi:hypothetical protein
MASGVPFPQAINVTNRGNGVGDTLVLLDPLGELIVGFSIIPSMDVFNLTNTNTVLSRRRNQYTFNGNDRRRIDARQRQPDQQHHLAARHSLRLAGKLGRRC